MSQLSPMYDYVPLEPAARLTSKLEKNSVTATIDDPKAVPEVLPGLMTIGIYVPGETVRVVAFDEETKTLTLERAVEGIAREWPEEAWIMRRYTALDQKAFIENINKLNQEKLEVNHNTSDTAHRNRFDDVYSKLNEKAELKPCQTYSLPITYPDLNAVKSYYSKDQFGRVNVFINALTTVGTYFSKNGAVLATLPEGFRPAQLIEFSAIARQVNSNTVYAMMISIDSDGVIRAGVPANVSSICKICFEGSFQI